MSEKYPTERFHIDKDALEEQFNEMSITHLERLEATYQLQDQEAYSVVINALSNVIKRRRSLEV